MTKVIHLVPRGGPVSDGPPKNGAAEFATADVITDLASAVEVLSGALLRSSAKLNSVETDAERKVLLDAWTRIVEGLEEHPVLRLRP